jgi:hypothetical protein
MHPSRCGPSTSGPDVAYSLDDALPLFGPERSKRCGRAREHIGVALPIAVASHACYAEHALSVRDPGERDAVAVAGAGGKRGRGQPRDLETLYPLQLRFGETFGPGVERRPRTRGPASDG